MFSTATPEEPQILLFLGDVLRGAQNITKKKKKYLAAAGK